MSTFLAQVETCLNSRLMSDDEGFGCYSGPLPCKHSALDNAGTKFDGDIKGKPLSMGTLSTDVRSFLEAMVQEVHPQPH